MQIIDLILISLILLGIYILIRKKLLKTKIINSKTQKKEDIIKEYENEMIRILYKYKDDEKQLSIKRKEFLLKVNKELAMNIFFDANETQEIIQKLVNIKLN
ncbi:hypothetical protein [Malaciobacter marinus]|uniref:Uncharacterized protein n=1 Tax=Malaciobacter marinus TaxID=505249 RepID=A0A347TJN4_9BACT|nr:MULTISPECIES: hypothetical protein [Malaciobacter]AXX86812.1 hypothetical protein AMRN_1061 [Malaciobacter marinus]PHO13064.1 hypothetical protein CPG38_04830 [Malaciobacter marinus]PHO14792.1 hypothetical protein CPH92_10200 [Malaciobacter marinus]RYA22282.1 hypothetical protein CRU96_14000 [Malaciobacter halophilus]